MAKITVKEADELYQKLGRPLTNEDLGLTEQDIEDSFKCMDCGVCTKSIQEYYMVSNDVWELAGTDKSLLFDGMLCIGCLEARVNRPLQSVDFTHYPINRGSFHMSPRLASRILGVKENELPNDYMDLVKSL